MRIGRGEADAAKIRMPGLHGVGFRAGMARKKLEKIDFGYKVLGINEVSVEKIEFVSDEIVAD